MTRIRTYSELERLKTFEERFEYLKLDGSVGRSTFGYDRYINQAFYGSNEWKTVRNHVILRDNGCDLGIIGMEINAELLVHHMNPMEVNDIVSGDSWILEPNFLITTTKKTHNAIHYGTEIKLPGVVTSRKKGDTKLW